MTDTKIGLLEWAGPAPSQEKKIVLIARCLLCGRDAFRDIPCPADLQEYPCGTIIAVNEFGRLVAVEEL